MPKIARSEEQRGSAERGDNKLTKIARSTTQQADEAGRENTEHTLKSAMAVQQSTGESAELGRAIVELLGQQSRHNMEVATAFGRAVNWADVAEIQRDFLSGSFNRMNQLGEHYRSMMQAGMKSMTFSARR